MAEEQNRRSSGDSQKRASNDNNKKQSGSNMNNNSMNKNQNQNQNQNQGQKSKNAGQSFNGKGGLPAKTTEGNWIESFGTPVAGFEHSIQQFITSRPIATAAIALGAGLAGAVILKKVNESQGPNTTNFQAGGAGGFLTKGISDTLHRFEDEMGRLPTGGINGVKEGVTKMVSGDFTAKPFETIATMVGLGYGLAHIDAQQLKRGAFRVAKLLAMRSLDEMGSKQQGIEGESYGQA